MVFELLDIELFHIRFCLGIEFRMRPAVISVLFDDQMVRLGDLFEIAVVISTVIAAIINFVDVAVEVALLME